jgi:type I restriction enzyme, S subunit
MAGEESTIGALLDETGGSIKTGPFGTKLKASEYTATGVPVISVGEVGFGRLRIHHDTPRVDETVSSRMPEFLLKAGDIVFGRKGAVERSAQVQPDEDGYFLGSDGIRIRLNIESCDAKFIAYQLQTPTHRSWMIQHAAGTTMPSLNEGIVRRIPIVLRPLAEQKVIAAVLGALDDKIELNRRMNATLEAMAQTLFQSWFVDFDPVRAKLDGRKPIGLDEATAALFPMHFTHSEHEMLPVGWRLASIEEVCDINAWTLGKNDNLEKLEYVEISEVSRGNIENIVTYSRGEEPSRARRRLRHGDTVLSTVRPDRGSYFLALNPPANRVASTGFVVITPTKVAWSFIHAALTMREVSDYLGQMADGGAYPAVRPEIIGAMQVALPDDPKILEAFHRTCAPFFEQAEANRTQSRTLAGLRDTLLPKLLSGELQVAA